MTTAFAKKPTLGKGIFTPTEIARFLKKPTAKINRWMKTYWDGKFANPTGHGASWKANGSKAVDFHTMIEMVVMGNLADEGARTREIVKAHMVLAEKYNSHHPFAMKKVLDQIRTDGRKVYLEIDGTIISLDGTHQINLDFIKLLLKNLDFDSGDLASRYWPMGKEKAVVVDPKRKFGHPVIAGKNIYPETIYGMVKAGDSPGFIAELYELSEKEVQDAIDYCSAA